MKNDKGLKKFVGVRLMVLIYLSAFFLFLINVGLLDVTINVLDFTILYGSLLVLFSAAIGVSIGVAIGLFVLNVLGWIEK